ncbi:MAG: AsmA-like C-terminal domain-containing protein [Mariprofundaceae bacterium]
MKRLLTACRRILLVGLAGLMLIAGWVYWQAPTLDELHPQLERILAGQLGLKGLHLGELSWRWAGHTWLKAKNITFTGPAERIRVEDAQLEVRLSSWDLLLGKIEPTRISLRHGRIALQIPRASSGDSLPVPAGQLRIEDSTVTLHYGDFEHRFMHLNLHLDATRRSLAMQLPGFTLDVDWDENLQPVNLQTHFDNLDWMPEAWRLHTRGEFNAQLDVRKSNDDSSWQFSSKLNSDSGAVILNKDSAPIIAFNAIQLAARIQTGANPTDIQAIEWQQFDWKDGENDLTAKGTWRDGILKLALQAETLNLKTLAALAKGSADDDWRAWTTAVQGKAHQLHGKFELAQPNVWDIPQFERLKPGDIQLNAHLSHASIPLGTANEALENLNSTLNIDADGLTMNVDSVTLPHQAGQVHGKLRIDDLHKPVLIIEGQGTVDVGRCKHWLNPTKIPQMVWKEAPADARFNFSWPLHAAIPDSGEAQLTPKPQWRIEFMQRPVRLSGGTLRWQANGTLHFSDMNLHYDDFVGVLDMKLKENTQAAWQLAELQLQSAGDFGMLTKHYRLPLHGASGHYKALLEFNTGRQSKNDPWRFTANLDNSAWQHLFGARKKTGAPYTLELSGGQIKTGFAIHRIQSSGGAPFISGSGMISEKQLALHISTLQTPAFSGAVSVIAPFSDAPLEIDITSDFLDQAALPKQMPEVKKMADIPAATKASREWVMRGNFSRIRWDAVSIRGVRIKFASSSKGVGTLEADALDAAQFSIRHVRSLFHLAANGKVDIRKLSAQILGQELHLSGMLQPQADSRLRWTGFAHVSGDFSQIIHRLDAAKLFQGGMVHALWSGNGIIEKNKPWWNGMHGRLRLRSDDGRILEGGTMTKFLAALSLTDLPRFLTGKREDITGPGMLYKRLQIESTVTGEKAKIQQLAMRASALDMAGQGQINLTNGDVDLYITARPLQNLDSFLRMIPLLRDVILGPANSVFRKIYRVHGPLYDAKVEAASPKQAGLPESGLLEQLISLPGRWFDASKNIGGKELPVLP